MKKFKISDNVYEMMYSINDYPILEMAFAGVDIDLGKNTYYIALHGPNSGDRPNPHIHIYLASDKNPWKKFNFEISLTDIVCHDEINLIRMKDVKNRKDITNRNKCSWDGYMKMYYDFEDWLYSDKVYRKGDFIDNLDAIIQIYNEESYDRNEGFIKYIAEKGLKVHPNYFKYFSDDIKAKYKICF